MSHSPHDDAGPGGAVGRYLHDHLAEMLDRLSEWVAIASVSADPDRRGEMRRSADWLVGEMTAAGMQARTFETGDTWAVYGESIVDPGAPTVLVYSHHDVRHAKPEEWSVTAPFAPIERDGRLYGRGASDAKGQALAHVWGLRAHREVFAGSGALNVKMIIDGEEEIGSPNLRDLLRTQRDLLACDVIVFSDTIQWRVDAPAPVTSMRGTVTATLTVRGPERDVHSGAASGVTPNPSLVLAAVLAGLHADDGSIAIEGFDDDVPPLTAQRRRELAALPFDDDDWLARSETRSIIGDDGYTPLERLWARPAIEVISLLAGDPEGFERSVIPREATASLSIRTAPGQRIAETADRLRAHMARAVPPEVAYEFTVDEDIAQEPYVTPGGPVTAALERALTLGYGIPVRGRMGNAGGGPADLLATELDATVHFLGTGLPEDHWHSSDESIDIRMLLRGAATIAHLWRELAALSPGGAGVRGEGGGRG